MTWTISSVSLEAFLTAKAKAISKKCPATVIGLFTAEEGADDIPYVFSTVRSFFDAFANYDKELSTVVG